MLILNSNSCTTDIKKFIYNRRVISALTNLTNKLITVLYIYNI